jgi:hypothetical protein
MKQVSRTVCPGVSFQQTWPGAREVGHGDFRYGAIVFAWCSFVIGTNPHLGPNVIV